MRPVGKRVVAASGLATIEGLIYHTATYHPSLSPPSRPLLPYVPRRTAPSSLALRPAGLVRRDTSLLSGLGIYSSREQ